MADVRNLHALPNIAVLKIPQHDAPLLERRLIREGLNPDRWFAVIHYREDSYGFRPRSEMRNSEPAAFKAVVDYIIDELGGQVVRLGHKEMTPFADRKGFVDISRAEDPFMLQAFATANARFAIVGPSGCAALACGFQIPLALVDATDPPDFWGDALSLTLTKRVVTDHGELRNADLAEAGLLTRKALEALAPEQVTSCTAAELRQVADILHNRTRDVEAWRPEYVAEKTPRPNSFDWPLSTDTTTAFLDLR